MEHTNKAEGYISILKEDLDEIKEMLRINRDAVPTYADIPQCVNPELAMVWLQSALTYNTYLYCIYTWPDTDLQTFLKLECDVKHKTVLFKGTSTF